MTDTQQRGPAWYDVHVALGVLERTHDVRARFVLERIVATKNRDQHLGLQLLVERRQGGDKLGKTPVMWSEWPHVDHKTMPGLMLKLVHMMDNALRQVAEEAQKHRPLALPF